MTVGALYTAGREGRRRWGEVCSDDRGTTHSWKGGGGVKCVVTIGALHTVGREEEGVECVVTVGALYTAGREGRRRWGGVCSDGRGTTHSWPGGGGAECVVTIGALHTAGREADVQDGGGGREATAVSGGKSESSWKRQRAV